MAEIKTVAVIGAGSAGRNIAQAAVLAGFRTILVDILPSSLRQAQSELRDRLQHPTVGGVPGAPGFGALGLSSLSVSEVDAVMQRLEIVGSVADAARDSDLVIEAVPDELESKLEIFTLLDKISRPHTILASTTSTLRVTEIASITYRKPRIVGMRFAFSANGRGGNVLKIVRTPDSDDETVMACSGLARAMGLECEVSGEY
jgi:3-hydroxybutyryl-CoA dehydrogenase